MKLMMIIGLIFSGNAVLAKAKDCTDYSKFTDVSKTEMQKIVTAKSAAIIDVNSTASYKESHIPGAIHFASAKESLKDKLPKDKSQMIVAYCGGKMCTAWQRAAKVACEMGYTNIRHFSAGITGWNKKG